MSGDGWAEKVRALVESTCAEQGVPVRVADRAVVATVVTLLGVSSGGGRAHAR